MEEEDIHARIAKGIYGTLEHTTLGID